MTSRRVLAVTLLVGVLVATAGFAAASGLGAMKAPVGGTPTASPVGGTPTASPVGGTPTASPVGGTPTASAGPGPFPATGDAKPASPVVGVQYHGLWRELSDRDRAVLLDRLAAAGVRDLRIDVSWSMLQPTRADAYDWGFGVALVDRVLRDAHARGFEVLATLWLTPGWANGGAGKRSLPRDPADYARFAAWAAERWRAEVQAWEVWNEPNSPEFLAPPDPTAYARLLRAAYPAIKAANPKATVVFGGTQYVDTAWIARAYAAGAAGSFDVMAVHPYQGDAALPPESPDDGTGRRLLHTTALLDLMARHGDSAKPVWFTEFGWSAHPNPAGTPSWSRGVSEAAQADYLVRTLHLVETRLPRVTRVYWYTSRDTALGRVQPDHRGLLRRDLSPRPAYEALSCYLQGC